MKDRGIMDHKDVQTSTMFNPFAAHLGIHVQQLGDGLAQAEMVLRPEFLNPMGNPHGGVYYTLADCAGGCACRTDGRKYVTLHGSLDHICPAQGSRLIAKSAVLRRGRTACFVDVHIFGEDQVLCAVGHYTFFCVKDHL